MGFRIFSLKVYSWDFGNDSFHQKKGMMICNASPEENTDVMTRQWITHWLKCQQGSPQTGGLTGCWVLWKVRSNVVYNMVRAARFTEVKCCYRLVLYGSCTAQDVRSQFTDRVEYIDLRDQHFWKMIRLRYHSKMPLKLRPSKYKYVCSSPQDLVKLKS